MKPIGFLSIAFSVIVLLALPAIAQDKSAPAPEAAKPEVVKPTPTKSAAPRKGPRRWNEDARHCLEKGSNTEVIKCAEEYL
jgi:hypothetical protein